jgi:hypothetical protein
MTKHDDFDNLSYPSFELLCEGIETIITANTNIAGGGCHWYDFDDLTIHSQHYPTPLITTPHK